MADLALRRGNFSRKRGERQREVYDVFDGHRRVGRMFQINAHPGQESWFWGVDFFLTYGKRYGHVSTLEQAKAAFRKEYEAWKAGPPMNIKAGLAWSPAEVAMLRNDVENHMPVEEIAKFLSRDVEEVRAKLAELESSR
jgi:hypothetical protein